MKSLPRKDGGRSLYQMVQIAPFSTICFFAELKQRSGVMSCVVRRQRYGSYANLLIKLHIEDLECC